MKLTVNLFVLMFVITSSTVYGCGPDFLVRSATKADGTDVGILVHAADFDGIPVWSPGENDPPLSVTKAREIALEWAQTKFSRYDSVEIPKVVIESVGAGECDSGEPKYLYVIEVLLRMDGNLIQDVGNWVAIFMDGTIVSAAELKS